MVKVYNTRAITRQERFQNALIYGIGATVIITLGYGLLSNLMRIEFSIVYLAIGYAIGMIIQKFGRGVQIQFSILAAVLAVFCFMVGDMISLFGFEILINPGIWPYAIQLIFMRLFSTNPNAILSLLFRLGGVLFAYKNARII